MAQKVVAVDLGGTNIRAALAQPNGVLLNVVREPARVAQGPQGVIEQMTRAIRRAAGGDWPDVTGVGMVTPGPLDPWQGVILYAPNLPGWKDVPIKRIFEQRLQRPVRIGNDANLAALAEHQFGVGRGLSHLIYLTVSTGIGSGIIVDNRLLLGADGLGAEAGQVIVDIGGSAYTGGLKGSVEALASGTAIARRARRQLSPQRGQAILRLAGSAEAITARHVGQAALAGDSLAIELFQEAGRAIGCAIISLLSLFNPQCVIIGGGVSRVGELLFTPIRQTVQANLHPLYWERCPIVPVSLGDEVGLLGGVAL
ncbi:MAG: ROK family protein, partial [Anaerolineae bacterium]